MSKGFSLDAPFPWFGGKRKVASLVWERFGDVKNYIEPFFGSGAVLLGRPEPTGNETVNDFDGFIANFWRAIKLSPEKTAEYADHPVNENDLHARHSWLLSQTDLVPKLEGDPDFHDPKIAGYWAWGICCWIGSGFCSGRGPWVVDTNRKLVHLGDNGQGVNRKLVHLGDNGKGVNRKLVHLGNNGKGVNRKLVHLGDNGQGVNRQLVHLGDNGKGVNRLTPWFSALSERLKRVRVCSGDWSRVCGPSVTFCHGITAVFLDPPYAGTAKRMANLYSKDSLSVAHTVREWAIENGKRADMRIALCGYEGEHNMPADWDVESWVARGGYSSQAKIQNENKKKERIWYSPACLKEPKLL